MIQHDRISQTFIILAVFIYVYLFTIAGSAVVLFPLVLMLLGLVLHRFVQRKGKEEFDDTDITNEHLWKNFIFYTVLAIFGVFVTEEAINLVPLTMNTGLTGLYALLFLALMGIAEEEFFRGFVTDWLLINLPNPYVAIGISGGIFAIYHLAVYGTVLSSILYVFVGGTILSWTAYRTQHVSPCMMGHVLNNVGAYLSQNGLNIGTSNSLVKMGRFIVKMVLRI